MAPPVSARPSMPRRILGHRRPLRPMPAARRVRATGTAPVRSRSPVRPAAIPSARRRSNRSRRVLATAPAAARCPRKRRATWATRAGAARAGVFSNGLDCDGEAGFYCFESRCVTGARCSLDRTLAYDDRGATTRCTTLLCENGACLDSCRRTADCAVGLVCDSYRNPCVSEAALGAGRTATIVSCRVGRVAPTPAELWWLLLAAPLARRRFRRRLVRGGPRTAPSLHPTGPKPP